MLKSNVKNKTKSRKRSRNKATNNSNINPISLKLPLIILNMFQNTSPLMAHCKLCNISVDWNSKKVVEHVSTCSSSSHFTSNVYKKFTNVYDCKVCKYETQCFSEYKNHVISSIHLTNCITIDNLYSYYCTICNLYIYGSKSIIIKHLKNKHNQYITKLPFIFNVLADNFKYLIDHPLSGFIDYCNDVLSEEHLESQEMQCYACKVNFYTYFNDYNLHKISSEHIILKYFAQQNQSLKNIKNYNEPLIPKSISNTNLIEPKYMDTENCNNNKSLQEGQVNKSQNKKNDEKNEVIFNSTLLNNNTELFGSDNEDKPYSVILSPNIDFNGHKNISNIDQIEGMPTLNFTRINISNSVHDTINYTDVSMNTNNLNLIDEMCDKLKTSSKQQEIFKNIGDIDYTQVPIKKMPIITVNETSNNAKLQEELISIDQKYGEYVTYRLKNINNANVKREIKLEIDSLLHTKIIQHNNNIIKE